MPPADPSRQSVESSAAAETRPGVSATEDLFAQVYGELRRLAECQLRAEKAGHTLQATALVHEAFLKLSGGERTWEDRRQFFVAAAEAMRRILVDHARKRKRKRRGGQRTRIDADLVLLPEVRPDDEVIALADAISDFEKEDPRAADLVKIRYFAGLTLDEAATVTGVSRATAARDWSYAKAWLRRKLMDAEGSQGSEAADSP